MRKLATIGMMAAAVLLSACATPYQMISGGGVVTWTNAPDSPRTVYFSAMHGGVPVLEQCWINTAHRLRCTELPLREALAERAP